MTPARIQHLLFDLGGTLMHARDDWESIHRRADEALVHELGEHGIELDSHIFRERLHEYYAQRDKDYQETTYHFVLREFLVDLGYGEIAEPIIRSALDALYAVTQTNWVLEDDSLATILELKAQSYHLGILSNAGDDQDVQEIIASFGVREYFDFVLTSAKCYYRKPHPRAFELALAHWNLPPQEAVMIGDSLEADIRGARDLKMHTIWITRRARFTDEEIHRIKPDFSVRNLNQLFPTLERISISHL